MLQKQLKRERQKAAKAKQEAEDQSAQLNGTYVPLAPPRAAAPPSRPPAPATDPAKRLKNLRKKIKAVDQLQVNVGPRGGLANAMPIACAIARMRDSRAGGLEMRAGCPIYV